MPDMHVASIARAFALLACFLLLPIAAIASPVDLLVETGVGVQNDSLPLGRPYPYPTGPTEWSDGYKGKEWDYRIHAYRYPTVHPNIAQSFLTDAVGSLERQVTELRFHY